MFHSLDATVFGPVGMVRVENVLIDPSARASAHACLAAYAPYTPGDSVV